MRTENQNCTNEDFSRRTESLASTREIESFECAVCGATMESWNSAWVPTYRLVAGPVRNTE